MENSKTAPVETQGVEYWEGELSYLEDAMSGIRTAYAIMEANHRFCQQKLKDLMPDREEVE